MIRVYYLFRCPDVLGNLFSKGVLKKWTLGVSRGLLLLYVSRPLLGLALPPLVLGPRLSRVLLVPTLRTFPRTLVEPDRFSEVVPGSQGFRVVRRHSGQVRQLSSPTGSTDSTLVWSGSLSSSSGSVSLVPRSPVHVGDAGD